MMTKPHPRERAQRSLPAQVDLESLYRLLATPSQGRSLKEGEVELERFDPSAPPLIIQLDEAQLESAEDRPLEQRSRAQAQPHSRAHQPSQSSAQSQTSERPQEEGESYLAFLDQVQSRAQRPNRAESKAGSKKGRQRKRRPKGPQSDSRGASSRTETPKVKTPKSETPQAETTKAEKGGSSTKRRRRRRAPKA